jgi:hypothetical protein
VLDRSATRQVEALIEEKQGGFLEQVEKLAMLLGAGVEEIHLNQVELNQRLLKVEEALGIDSTVQTLSD